MEEGMSKNFVNIIKGVFIAVIFTLIFIFIFSLLLTYTNISESFITPVIIVITAISIFIGSSIGNIKLKKNGLINGALIGGIYLLSIYLLSGIINKDFGLSMQSIFIIIAGMLCGMFGGIIGVNKK